MHACMPSATTEHRVRRRRSDRLHDIERVAPHLRGHRFGTLQKAHTTMKYQMRDTRTPTSRGPNPKPPNNAEIVFARVRQLLQQQNNPSASEAWLKQNHTIADVQEQVTKAQERYNLRSKDSKIRKWLSRFSSGVLYYGQILDVLVQHHPEYVSLAWGTTKSLFVVSPIFSKRETLPRDEQSVKGVGDADSSVSQSICLLRWTIRFQQTADPFMGHVHRDRLRRQ